MNNIIIGCLLSCFVTPLFVSGQTFEGKSEPLYALNSAYAEEFIAVHPSGNQLAFSRSNHPYNQGNATDEGDIWMSKFDSSWHAATNWHEVNSDNISSPIGWSGDGKTFLFNKITKKGGVLNTEIWAYSAGRLQRQDIQYFKNKSIHQSGYLSADNRYLIVSIESGSTQSVEDLYVIKRQGDKWSAPKNLGSTINSEYQEITPFLSADNRTLYFATNGREGEGSFDIYKSTRLDDTWREWSEPVNLGPSVNSQGRESSFVFNQGASHAYFVSTRSSDGYGDIRRIAFKSDSVVDVIDIDTAQFVSPVASHEKGIKLIDAKSSEPIKGQARIISERIQTIKIDSGGLIPIESSATGTIEIQGFLSKSFPAFSDSLIVVRLEPLEVGRTIRLENVLFARGKDVIGESSYPELNRVADMMKSNPDVKILLKGHTDGNGDPEKNRELSETRANSTKKYLLSRGISRKRISSIGLGGTEPIASNSSEETRKLNRRVEIEFVE